MAKRDPNIIREGDLVRVVSPEVLIRVGYPMSQEDALKAVREKYDQAILDVIEDMHGVSARRREETQVAGFSLIDRKKLSDTRCFKNVMRELSYGYLRAKGFGGRERRIYTRTEPKLKGEVFPVRRVKIHKTGDYFGPSGGYCEWTGDYDYEPGGLENERTHKFVDVCTYGMLKMDGSDGTWIEVCNVEKVKE